MQIIEKAGYQPKWTLRKYASDAAYLAGEAPYETVEIDGNLLLNEGIGALALLLTGGAATAFNNANSYIGVGDSATAAAATQTALQAATNKAYMAMAATYPQIAAQTVTWRGVFDGNTANYAWNEMTVANGAGGDTAVNLNRKVSAQGTKTTGQTWTLDLAVTFS